MSDKRKLYSSPRWHDFPNGEVVKTYPMTNEEKVQDEAVSKRFLKSIMSNKGEDD